MDLKQHDSTLPPDHAERVERAWLSLAGLSVGDAFGEKLFHLSRPARYIRERVVAAGPWEVTDDTVMALSIVETLEACGRIDQDDLARRFAARFRQAPWRGYGRAAIGLLEAIAGGADWRQAAGRLFDGQGSMGNGSAMRVGPVGAYFAGDLSAVVEQARASAEVTHAHRDGQAGAVAAAIAAACAWRLRGADDESAGRLLIDAAVELTPEGPVRQGLVEAARIPFDRPVADAATVLGNGSRVTCADTVPFCVWCAAAHLASYEEAIWATASVLGDVDTTCAIVGSIVVLAGGDRSIPPNWLAAREPLPPGM